MIRGHADKCATIISGADWPCDCDGFHTWDDLYEHRFALLETLCRFWAGTAVWDEQKPWRSKLHSDGSMYDGWFIVGIGYKPGEQITYHLPVHAWERFSHCETLERAPEWDGHTPDDVLERLRRL